MVREKPARPSLDRQHFQVVILGGGINGVAIARECARAGRRTLLVERNDFASGTTSRSTRIIHGGLRYLEHGEVALVRESLKERACLLAQRPHLVRSRTFLLALPPGRRSALEVRLGLWLYRRFSDLPKTPSAKEQITQLEKQLDGETPWSVFSYEDAQCEFPERLVAEWLLEGITSGLIARNHTEIRKINIVAGKVSGVRLNDTGHATEFAVTCDHLINATGPWVDQVCSKTDVKTSSPLVGGIRGSHIVVPQLPGLPTSAVYSEALDGRPFFAIPWNGQLLVGTTEVTDDGDPSSVAPSADECAYLLGSLQRMFPQAGVTSSDICYAFAGVRPLPHTVTTTKPSAITRRHFLHDHAQNGAAGMISIVGGKLTTAASLARECVRMIGVEVLDHESPMFVPPGDFRSQISRCVDHIASIGQISNPTAYDIAEWHGRSARNIAQIAGDTPAVRRPICELTTHIVAEAVFATQEEMAMTLGDILLRRVPVALDRSWTNEATCQAATSIGSALGWSSTEIASQSESFEEERAAFLQKPTGISSVVSQHVTLSVPAKGLGQQSGVVTN